MVGEQSVVDRSHSGQPDPPVRHYVYWGAIAGLISSLATLFILSAHYGHTLGHGSASCVVVGCTLTAMLSQVVGLLGLAVGAGCGAIIGVVAHLVRQWSRTR